MILVQLSCLALDLMAYRKKTDLGMKQSLAILGLGLAADLGSLLVAAGACAVLGFILGTLCSTGIQLLTKAASSW